MKIRINKKTRTNIYRALTLAFLVIFVLSIAAALIFYGNQPIPGAPPAPAAT